MTNGKKPTRKDTIKIFKWSNAHYYSRADGLWTIELTCTEEEIVNLNEGRARILYVDMKGDNIDDTTIPQ